MNKDVFDDLNERECCPFAVVDGKLPTPTDLDGVKAATLEKDSSAVTAAALNSVMLTIISTCAPASDM